MNEMKWRIFNENGEPLCADDQAIFFSSENSARRFAEAYVPGATIKEGILFYDGGHIDGAAVDKSIFDD